MDVLNEVGPELENRISDGSAPGTSVFDGSGVDCKFDGFFVTLSEGLGGLLG
jgi:hypothetical protein